MIHKIGKLWDIATSNSYGYAHGDFIVKHLGYGAPTTMASYIH